jgi:hypothetical protein
VVTGHHPAKFLVRERLKENKKTKKQNKTVIFLGIF